MNKSNKVSNDELDRFRDEWKSTRLKISTRPSLDLVSNNDQVELKEEDELKENVKQRLEHLAAVLETLSGIYHSNKDLYGDAFLAFIGNSVIREWPWKDYPLASNAAKEIAGNTELIGKTKSEVDEELKNQLHYEHWTPISFFRDLIACYDNLTKENFIYILEIYYKVVWITREENNRLNNDYRTTRPIDAYEQTDIKVNEL